MGFGDPGLFLRGAFFNRRVHVWLESGCGQLLQMRLGVLAVHVGMGEIAPLCACASEPTLPLSLLGRSCWAACGDRFTGLETESVCVYVRVQSPVFVVI